MYEFTITEDNLDADKFVDELEDRPPSGRLKALEHTRPSSEIELSTKYRVCLYSLSVWDWLLNMV